MSLIGVRLASIAVIKKPPGSRNSCSQCFQRVVVRDPTTETLANVKLGFSWSCYFVSHHHQAAYSDQLITGVKVSDEDREIVGADALHEFADTHRLAEHGVIV